MSDIRVPLDFDERELGSRFLTIIGVPKVEMIRFSVVRRGFDARGTGGVRRVYAVECELASPELEGRVCARVSQARPFSPEPDPLGRGGVAPPSVRPLVVGAGPAGLFAAMTLARFGARPLLLERGRAAGQRQRDVSAFWATGAFDPESNVQFGEGGAGTFSDGKLTTRIGDPLVGHVVSTFEEFADLPGLSVEAKPHVGTDRLLRFCRKMRAELAELGGEIRFGARVDDLVVADGRVRAVRLASGEEIPCESLVLAIGHSSRDTLRMLHARGVAMSAKPFAVGFRVEHKQPLIDRIQYGAAAGHAALPPADYRLAAKAPSGRGVWSFCMCPGGRVITASSEAGGLPVNGMSANRRDSGFANSGIVAAVGPSDFGGDGGALAGLAFQERIEQAAFRAGGGGYGVPAANLMGFIGGRDVPLSRSGALAAAVVPSNLRGILPAGVEDDLRAGLRRFGQAMRGFATEGATLYAVESRTSAPVQFARVDFESTTVKGLYPVGEGAGHAGGIVSSAVDGVRAALRILETLSK
jgi:uncharacterized FAD-dependent dehydrogenase